MGTLGLPNTESRSASDTEEYALSSTEETAQAVDSASSSDSPESLSAQEETGDTAEPLDIFRDKQVLVTEDNRQIRRLLAMRMKHLGAIVHEVENGREAWTFLNDDESPRPDVVLLDMMMPDMNGIELLGMIRKSEALSDLPVFVISAKRDRKLVILLMKMGIQGYMVKPLKLGETLMRIGDVLRGESSIM